MHRTLRSGIMSCAALLWVTSACQHRAFNPGKVQGLRTEDSNIATVNLKDLSQLRAPSPLHVPKGVILAFTTQNASLVTEMYKYIHTINRKEKLEGDDGRNQEITLVVVMMRSVMTGQTVPATSGVRTAQGGNNSPTQVPRSTSRPLAIPPESYDTTTFPSLKQMMAQAIGAKETDSLPHVKFVATDEKANDQLLLWMKDWGEFFIGVDKGRYSQMLWIGGWKTGVTLLRKWAA